MKAFYPFLFLLLCTAFTPGCELLEDECVADIAVTALDAPAVVLTGNPIRVFCILKNIIQTASSCTTSEAGTVTVTCGYSETFEDQFSEYEVIDTYQETLDPHEAGSEQIDEMLMETSRGPGYYAMKVEVDSGNDVDHSNDARAVSIRAD